MTRKRFVLASVVLVALARTAMSQPTPATRPTQAAELPVAAQTVDLWQRWGATTRTAHSTYEPARGSLLEQLAAAPDADLCFLKTVDARRGSHDWLYMTARDQLGKLNTQRTFDAIAAKLKAPKWFDREEAVELISAYKRPECVPLLAGLIENDSNDQVKVRAAEALVVYADPRAEPALLNAAKGENESVALAAARALAAMNSPDGLEPTLWLLRKASGNEQREAAILAVGTYHRKQAVQALLDEYERLLPGEEGWPLRLKHDAEWRLASYAAITSEVLGPKPDTLEQWRDWWSRADPLLSDDLELKARVAKAPRDFREADFAKTPEAIELRATVDSKEYRVGDPIRLELEMENHSKSPYSLVLPALPSGWWPTMGYGVRLQRGATTVAAVKPSGDCQGSYSGPPAFQALGPGEVFRSSICLQHWLRGNIDLPLSEGEYELVVAFDSSQFPGIRAQGVQLVHRWDAAPVHFTVKGDPLHDPAALLSLIGQKTGLRWIEQDLTSPQAQRREPAWRAVLDYGDSRLAPLIEKIETEHPRAARPFLNVRDLEPFEVRGKATGERGDE